MGSAAKDIRGLVNSSRKQEQGVTSILFFKVLGRGLKGFQNSTTHGRSLSDGIGNKTIVPKGVVRTLYQDLEVRRARTRRSVQLTQSNAECHRVVERAVP